MSLEAFTVEAWRDPEKWTLPVVKIMGFFRLVFWGLWQSHMYFMWKNNSLPFMLLYSQTAHSSMAGSNSFLATFLFLLYLLPLKQGSSAPPLYSCIIFHWLSILEFFICSWQCSGRKNTGTAIVCTPRILLESTVLSCYFQAQYSVAYNCFASLRPNKFSIKIK